MNHSHLPPLTVAGHSIEFVNSLTYLGVKISKGLRGTHQVEINISLALRAVASYRKLWGRSDGLLSNQKIFIYTQYIRPRLELAAAFSG